MTRPHGGATNGRPGAPSEPFSDAEAARVIVHHSRAGKPVPADVAKRLPPAWGELLLQVEETGLDEGIATWLRFERVRLRADAPRFEALVRALEEARAGGPEADPDETEAETLPPFLATIIGSADFASKEYDRRWLVERIAVRGQPTIVGGPRKGLKTSQLVDFVISLGSATRFLGEFGVPRPTKVLFLSGESGDATIQETALRVCKAKQIDMAELDGWVFWGFDLPRLSHPKDVESLADFIRKHAIECVVIDPLYLCLLTGNTRLDPANLFDVGPLLTLIAGACLGAGSTPVLCHHLRKNREEPFSPPELEDLAYAGIQEFARQWVMIGRRERYEPGTGSHKLWLSAGGSAGHSGAWAVDIEEGVVDDEFRERRWNVVVVRATEARQSAEQARNAARDEREAERRRHEQERKAQETEADAARIIGMLQRLMRATKTQLREGAKISGARASAAILLLLDRGSIRRADVLIRAGKGHRTEDGYELVDGTLFRQEGRTRTHPDTPGLSGFNPGSARASGEPGQGEGLSPVGGGPPNPGSVRGAEATLTDTPANQVDSTHKYPGSEGANRGVES